MKKIILTCIILLITACTEYRAMDFLYKQSNTEHLSYCIENTETPQVKSGVCVKFIYDETKKSFISVPCS